MTMPDASGAALLAEAAAWCKECEAELSAIIRQFPILTISPGPKYGAVCRKVLDYAMSLRAADLILKLGRITIEDEAELGQALRHVQLLASWLEERAAVSAPDGPSGDRPAKRRTGRPRQGESDKETLVIGALVKHHRYQPGGSVENYTHATTKQLAKLASGKYVKVSVATVSRFFKKKFPDQGYKGYVSDCTRELIGAKLALWQGEVAERLTELLPHESGSEDNG
jgi:hypothetical protein